jgi:ABC-2 type transport system permease protein
MIAIFKREFQAYFYSPLGYVFVGIYWLIAGFFFFNSNLVGNTSDMRSMFSTLFIITLFLIPVLTMKLMSEDKKTKTDQLLLMSPISSWSIVVGKFLAALSVYTIALALTFVMAIVLEIVSNPDWILILGHIIGSLLLGGMLISITLFISATTENQIIAAVLGFAVGFFLMLLTTLAKFITNPTISNFVVALSPEKRYLDFTLGILDISNIVFFLSFIVLFLYFTVALFEMRKYR